MKVFKNTTFETVSKQFSSFVLSFYAFADIDSTYAAPGDLTFESLAYDWLVVSGPKAQFKGSGAINGVGDYGFILTANDGVVGGGGGEDRFRIKIWGKTTEDVIYDNQSGDSDNADAVIGIGAGNIIVHK